MRAAIVGTGHIAASYARTLLGHGATLVACTDIDTARAEHFAQQWGTIAVGELSGLLDHAPDVAINLTPPLEHATVSTALVELGIPVYTEKPIAHALTPGQQLVAASDRQRVTVMCAPDILFGGPQQQMCDTLDAGLIGRPQILHGQMAWGGHELWHPRPSSFYRAGAGPLLDLGPYWITMMVTLAGSATAVTAARASTDTDTLHSTATGNSHRLRPEVPLTAAVLVEFDSGAIGSLLLSFEWPPTTAPSFLVIGETGTLACDTPLFEGIGTLRLRSNRQHQWTALPQTEPTRWQRGIGVVHMLRNGRACEPRLDKRLALHVLDILQAASISINTGERVRLTTTYAHPAR